MHRYRANSSRSKWRTPSAWASSTCVGAHAASDPNSSGASVTPASRVLVRFDIRFVLKWPAHQPSSSAVNEHSFQTVPRCSDCRTQTWIDEAKFLKHVVSFPVVAWRACDHDIIPVSRRVMRNGTIEQHRRLECLGNGIPQTLSWCPERAIGFFLLHGPSFHAEMALLLMACCVRSSRPAPVRSWRGHGTESLSRRIGWIQLLRYTTSGLAELRAGHVVDTGSTPWMTSEDALEGHPAAFEPPVSCKGLQCVCRTCGLKAAMMPDPRAERQPVCPDGKGQDPGKRTHL